MIDKQWNCCKFAVIFINNVFDNSDWETFAKQIVSVEI